VRRLVVPILATLLAGCAYQPEVVPPEAGTAPPPSPPPSLGSEAPGTPVTDFTAEGCPVDEPAFCEQAANLANALVAGDSDAVFDLSRPDRFDCEGLDTAIFPQCEDRDALSGYALGTHQGEIYYLRENAYRGSLGFFVEAVDEGFTDEFGGSEMQVLGVSSCGSGADRSYHVVYFVGLADPDNAAFSARFLGTYELVERDGDWVVGITYVGGYTDWQLVMDDPIAEIACGDTRAWELPAG
jgi:hypothetical protein